MIDEAKLKRGKTIEWAKVKVYMSMTATINEFF